MIDEPQQGMATSPAKRSDVPPLLDDVAAAAERVRALEREQRAAMETARDDLRRRVRAARDEGVPFAVIGRAAGLSRERVRQLYAGR